MTTILLLFGIGLLLVSLEVFLPGGILGVLGALVMIIGVVLAFRDYGMLGGAAAFGAGVALFAAALVIEFVLLPKTRFGQRFFLAAEIKGQTSSTAGLAHLVGRECTALTVLAPSGVVSVENQRIEAFCRDGFAERGAALVVSGADNFRLIVSKRWNPSTSS